MLLHTNFLADALLAPAVTWTAVLLITAFVTFLGANAASQWVREP